MQTAKNKGRKVLCRLQKLVVYAVSLPKVPSPYHVRLNSDSGQVHRSSMVRSVAKSYLTSCCIQNLSKRASKRQTVSTSTTELSSLFQNPNTMIVR